MSWDAGDYNTVPERIAEFRAKHPEGSLQPANVERPFEVVTIADKTFIAYAAAAYRTPDDPRPGIGVAYEPFPGPTNFTRNSELQNAETSAWGRAIVACLAADAKKGIATADEVRARRAEQSGENAAPGGRVCELCGETVTTDVKVLGPKRYAHKACAETGEITDPVARGEAAATAALTSPTPTDGDTDQVPAVSPSRALQEARERLAGR